MGLLSVKADSSPCLWGSSSKGSSRAYHRCLPWGLHCETSDLWETLLTPPSFSGTNPVVWSWMDTELSLSFLSFFLFEGSLVWPSLFPYAYLTQLLSLKCFVLLFLTSMLLRIVWNNLLLAVTDFGFLPRCNSSSHLTFSYCRHKQSLPETPVRSLIQQIFIIYLTTCEGQYIILMNTKSILKERGDTQINVSRDAKGTSWGREDRDSRASFPWGIREEPRTMEHFCGDLKGWESTLGVSFV